MDAKHIINAIDNRIRNAENLTTGEYILALIAIELSQIQDTLDDIHAEIKGGKHGKEI